MAIQDLTIQVLEKFSEEEHCEIKSRNDLLRPNADSESLFQTLKKQFNAKPGKAFGQLKKSADQAPFALWLDNWKDEKLSFLSFTERAIKQLKDNTDTLPITTQSYHIWILDRQGPVQTLYWFVLESGVTQHITNELSIEPIEHLDLHGLTFAVRIDLSGYLEPAAKDYAAVFLQRGQRKLADACAKTVGFQSTVDTSKDTQCLLESLERYTKDLPLEEAAVARKTAIDFCREQEERGEAVSLSELSADLDDSRPAHFADYVQINHPDTAEMVRPDSRKLKQLVRFSGRSDGVSLSFSSESLNNSITYDAEKDALVITDIPKSLKAHLKRFLSNQSEADAVTQE